MTALPFPEGTRAPNLRGPGRPSSQGFRHEALFYRGQREFLDATLEFVRGGLESDEAVLIMVPDPKIRGLRDALGPDAERVHFADMSTIGTNPARIIPAWYDFVAVNKRSGRQLRGVGEPIWPDRSPAELVECQLHESLLNSAIPDTAPLWLLCPYDGQALGPGITNEARRSHPHVWESDVYEPSTAFQLSRGAGVPWDLPLPAVPVDASELSFHTGEQLRTVRSFIGAAAAHAGFAPDKAAEIVVAVHEVVTNSIRHGGGRGTLRVWTENSNPTEQTLIYEVTDAGRIDDPLVGRVHPSIATAGGRGVWMANQLCDLVQLRHESGRNIVRLHLRGAGT